MGVTKGEGMPKKTQKKAREVVVRLSVEEAGLTLGILLLAQINPKEFGMPIPHTLDESINKLRAVVHTKK